VKRLLAACVLLAGCFEPFAIRRESSELTDEAGPRLRAAVSPTAAAPPVAARFQQHYQAALGFYNARQYPEAIAEFEAAYGVDGQPMLLYNIGQAYRKAGKLELALAKYREYLAKDPAAERERVRPLIEEIERKLAKRKR